MKIIVYNSRNQYALSRKQIEIVKCILPNEYFDPIQEFHITHSKRGSESFEYIKDIKQVHFCFPISQKTSEIVAEALTELLIGLARMKAKTRWGHPLSEDERIIYRDFVEQWHRKCISAFQAQAV